MHHEPVRHPPGPALEASGLVKSYGDTPAVAGVDLSVDPGVIHGLLGPNGAGKTTVLAMIFGLVPPDAGVLRVLGRPVSALAGLDGVAGFVESPRFYPYLDARSNLAGLAALDGAAGADVDRALAEVGLDGLAGRKVRGFSLGMRQRLGLAAALIRRPRLVVVDEPANGLDPAGTRDLRDLLARLAGEGVAVVLSSHDMHQVEDLCDEVTVMRSGRVTFSGTLAEMRACAPDPLHRLVTSDDPAALALASSFPVEASVHDDGGVALRAGPSHLDAYVLALGRAGVAVRALTQEVTPLESLFFALTEGPGVPSSPEAVSAGGGVR